MENSVAINIKSPAIFIKHSELEPKDDLIFRRDCPKCNKGVLPVRRNRETFELEAEDMCILCGQKFIYQDIKEMRGE